MADVMDQILAAEREDLEQRRAARNGVARPGAENPPPGWLATSVLPSGAPPIPGREVAPSTNPLGGMEVSPLSVSGTPIPIGSPTTTPGGQTVTPVANPARPRVPENINLEDLGGQYRAIQNMLGPAPQMPMVRDQVINNSPTYGLMSFGSRGGMVGPQVQGGVSPNQADMAELTSATQRDLGRGQDVGQLLGRLGTMGSQGIELRRLFDPSSPEQIRATNDNPADVRLASRLNSALDESRRRNPNWSPAQHWQAAADAEGTTIQRAQAVMGAIPRPRAQLPGGANPTIPSPGAVLPQVQPAGPVTPTARTAEGLSTSSPPAGGRNSAPTSAQQAWQTFEDTHGSANPADPRSASRYQAGLRTSEQINSDITDFVNLMPQGVLNSDIGNVHRILIEKFGTGPVDRWYSQSFSRGSRNPANEALQSLRQAQNSAAPGVVGVNTNTRNLINSLIRPLGFENTSGQ